MTSLPTEPQYLCAEIDEVDYAPLNEKGRYSCNKVKQTIFAGGQYERMNIEEQHNHSLTQMWQIRNIKRHLK